MTIEEEFFKAFGIEKQLIYLVMDMGKSHICDKETVILNEELFKQKSRRCYVKAVNKVYPEITAEILLKLIDILREYYNLHFWGNLTFDLIHKQYSPTDVYYRTGGTLKEIILSSFVIAIRDKNLIKQDFKKQVQALLKECE